MRLNIKIWLAGALLLAGSATARAQFLDATTGLLSMPTAVTNPGGTFMITANFLNKNYTPPAWDYHTFGYGFDVALWDRLEVAYVLAVFHGYRTDQDGDAPGGAVTYRYTNQDRHFSAKVLALREGEFGLNWMPALALGVSDLTSAGDGTQDYSGGTASAGNGYFNRWYIVATKHFNTPWGEIGAHAGYQTNQLFVKRKDRIINAPCAGINWRPIWLQTDWLTLDLVAEYDSLNFNLGFIASLWHDRVEAMFDLQSFRYVSFGLRYKMCLRN